jgi:hypothetical protein
LGEVTPPLVISRDKVMQLIFDYVDQAMLDRAARGELGDISYCLLQANYEGLSLIMDVTVTFVKG